MQANTNPNVRPVPIPVVLTPPMPRVSVVRPPIAAPGAWPLRRPVVPDAPSPTRNKKHTLAAKQAYMLIVRQLSLESQPMYAFLNKVLAALGRIGSPATMRDLAVVVSTDALWRGELTAGGGPLWPRRRQGTAEPLVVSTDTAVTQFEQRIQHLERHMQDDTSVRAIVKEMIRKNNAGITRSIDDLKRGIAALDTVTKSLSASLGNRRVQTTPAVIRRLSALEDALSTTNEALAALDKAKAPKRLGDVLKRLIDNVQIDVTNVTKKMMAQDTTQSTKLARVDILVRKFQDQLLALELQTRQRTQQVNDVTTRTQALEVQQKDTLVRLNDLTNNLGDTNRLLTGYNDILTSEIRDLLAEVSSLKTRSTTRWETTAKTLSALVSVMSAVEKTIKTQQQRWDEMSNQQEISRVDINAFKDAMQSEMRELTIQYNEIFSTNNSLEKSLKTLEMTILEEKERQSNQSVPTPSLPTTSAPSPVHVPAPVVPLEDGDTSDTEDDLEAASIMYDWHVGGDVTMAEHDDFMGRSASTKRTYLGAPLIGTGFTLHEEHHYTNEQVGMLLLRPAIHGGITTAVDDLNTAIYRSQPFTLSGLLFSPGVQTGFAKYVALSIKNLYVEPSSGVPVYPTRGPTRYQITHENSTVIDGALEYFRHVWPTGTGRLEYRPHDTYDEDYGGDTNDYRSASKRSRHMVGESIY